MAKHRAYGKHHERRPAALLPKAIGTACPLCGLVMLRTQALDLDHTNPADKLAGDPGDRIVHATCNRGRWFEGKSLGPEGVHSREW